MKKCVLRRLFTALLALCLVLGLTACGGNEPNVSESAPGTTTTTVPTVSYETLNPLTGIKDMTSANNRPIGFVITDEDSKHIQLNIESADMYFEAETEGGIPRILAIYSSIDRIPDVIGPVRSARPHFVKMAAALDLIYGHIGGSASGLSTIKKLGVDDLNSEYEVNSVLANSNNLSWNRSAFTKAKVLPSISKKKYQTTTSRKSPFVFGEKAGNTPATTLVVKISSSYDMAFTYDATSGLYQKHRNSLSTPVHKTHTGGTITAKNVIVMFDNRTIDVVEHKANGGTTTRYDFNLNSGEGLLVSGGTARTIQWKRTNNQLSYYEADGTTPLTVAPGKTYVCLTNKDLKERTTVS